MSRSSAPFSPVQSRRRAAWYAQRGGTGAAVAAQAQTAQQVPALLQEVAAAGQPAANPADPAPASSAAAVEAASQPAARLTAGPVAAAEASATHMNVAGPSDLAVPAAAAAPHAASDTSSLSDSGSSASGSAHGPGQQQGQASHAKKLGLKGGFGIGKKRLKRKGGNIFGAAAAEVLRFAPLCARL